jgi:hypothetical protein
MTSTTTPSERRRAYNDCESFNDIFWDSSMQATSNKPKILNLDSNEFLSKSLLHYIAEPFLASRDIRETIKESIF